MKERDNQGGGTTIILASDDSLESVPESHRDIVTNEIQDAFRDPHQYFLNIARQANIRCFRDYLTKIVSEGQWRLILADTYMMQRETVGAFFWSAEGVHGTMIAPGPAAFDFGDCHPDFEPLYTLVQLIHWGEVAFAGGLLPPARNRLLCDSGYLPESKQFPEDSSTVFGNTSCGDLLVYDHRGAAGLFSHENGHTQMLGTIPEALEWVFSELLSGREPNLDYGSTGQSTIGLWSPPE